MNHFMKEAIRLAKEASKNEEVPVGAVVVYNGEIIGRGSNKRETSNDPTNHAEIMAIRQASKALESWRLNECEMYVTKEPCIMCTGALVNSRIKKIYIGCLSPKDGYIHSIHKVNESKLNHSINYEYGIDEEECSNLLKDFFKSRR